MHHFVEKEPINWIKIPYDTIKSYDTYSTMTIELYNQDVKSNVNDVAYFIVSSDNHQYTNVDDYEVNDGTVTFRMPKLETGRYYPQIMDNNGRVYSSLDTEHIEVVYNMESRRLEIYPIIKDEIIEEITPKLKEHISENAFLFTGPPGEDGSDFEYSDFTPKQLEDLTGPKGPKGYTGNRGQKGHTGEKGDTGDKGDKGDKGDTGDIENVNGNLINHAVTRWENGAWNSETALGYTHDNRIRLIKEHAIPLTNGNEYTFSDASTYTSGMASVLLIELDGETVTGSHTVDRTGRLTFTATGTSLILTLVNGEGLSVRQSFLEDRIKMKLEKGVIATPWVQVFNDSVRKTTETVEQYEETRAESISGHIEGYIQQQPFTSTSGGQWGADRVSLYTLSTNTETLNADGEFLLKPGVWNINFKLAIGRKSNTEGYFAMAVYLNDTMLERDIQQSDSHGTLQINRNLFVEPNDILQLRVYSLGVFGDGETAEYQTLAENYNPVSMTYIKEEV